MAPHPPHHIRRVVLPSGKTVEVVYFEDRVPASAVPAVFGHGEEATDPHVCGGCGSDLVYASDWHATRGADWVVTLRCPDCEWTHTDVFEQAAVDRFDASLVEGTGMLIED